MAKTPRSLAGEVVAITGGARGIGRATAEALVRQGARVAIGDIESALAEQTAREIGAGTIGLALDVTRRESFERFLTEVEQRLGALDVLINNAGIMPVGPFLEESDRTAQRLVDINLHGVILGSKLALERFAPRGGGHLVNVASSAGKAGFAGGATYCATKHAVVGLSEAIRQEFRDRGVRVSIVMPVVVQTELGSGLGDARGFKPVTPQDVAAEIVAALQLDRVDVYVPRSVGPVLRSQSVMPRRVTDWFTRMFRSDQVLTKLDHRARADYEARIERTVAAPELSSAASTGEGDSQTEPAAAGRG
jgi:NAD(P)-dependent dehydrogenase (short-subunit alcohol dehydrogenase family)